MSYYPHLFSKVSIGSVELQNRIVMPAMATNATTDGTASKKIIDYFVERARGQVGLIITEASAVVTPPGGKLGKYHLNVSDDRYIPSLKRLAENVHRYDTKVAVQLSHLGRQIHSRFLGAQPVAPSPIACPVCRDMPKELTIKEIESIVESFVAAAGRAAEAGFDMVELHGCHGYLIGQFFSLRTNKRTDVYGGDVRGRTRFCREIIEGIKGELGASYPVIVRINGHDHIREGATLKDMQEIAPLLVEAGADALHVSGGVYGSFTATVAPMLEREGCFLDLAKGIKAVANVPIIAVGRIRDPNLAEETIKSGNADLIAMGRALIADPALPHKAVSGNADDICKCVGCNQGCIDRINDSMMTDTTEVVTCLVNPQVLREAESEILPAEDPRKILIIGGGPAGLEAALIAARRGHAVTLWEREGALGGQLLLAGSAPGREAYREYISFMERQIRNENVHVLLNKEGTYDSIRESMPDVLIYAAGARPVIPSFAESSNNTVIAAWEVLKGTIPQGEKIAIIGGGAVGLETAHFLSERGKKITVLEAMEHAGRDMGAITSFYLRGILKKAGVVIICRAEVQEIIHNEILISREGTEERLSNIDAVILAMGAQSDDALADKIMSVVPEVHRIGDAVKPRKALDAIAEGFEIGRTI